MERAMMRATSSAVQASIDASRQPAKHTKPKEEFVFGRYRFDIEMVRQRIAANTVPFITESVSIKQWAEHVLLLDRAQPDRRRASLMVGIDHDYVRTITPERCRDPIFVVTLDLGLLVIDGNHRVARAYLDGADVLPAIVFDTKATESLLQEHSCGAASERCVCLG